MANAVTPIQQGWDYQARLFWQYAVRLFVPGSGVSRVGHEVDPSGAEGARAFDDVVVLYDDHPAPGEFGRAITADFFQAKFKVVNNGAFTWQALTDPAFIGATKHSLLQRLRDAQRKHAPSGTGARFQIVSPWPVHPDDKLAEVWSNNGGYLRFDKLFTAKFADVRDGWMQHLALEDEEDLRRVLAPLRIRTDFGDLVGLRERLEPLLPAYGFAPFPPSGASNQYDDLPRKLAGSGRTVFTRAELQEVLQHEGLWVGVAAPKPSTTARRIGVRSFMRAAERMEESTNAMRCLVGYFDGRWIREPALWQDAVLPELTSFLVDAVLGAARVDVHLDTHSSIAFAAGWLLDSKSGVAAYPVQRGPRGVEVWCDHDGPPCRDRDVWDGPSTVDGTAGGHDAAVVLAVRHAAAEEAIAYVRAHVPAVGRIVVLTPCGGASSAAVRDAAHARRLAQDAAKIVRTALVAGPRGATVHLFASAPNGLVFFLGQEARVFGRCVLYEYDFGKERPLAYEPALTLRP